MANPQRRPRPTNIPSKLLTNAENDQLFALIGQKCVTLASAVVQVVLGEPPSFSRWMKRCCGVACFVKDNPMRSYYIRVYNISTGGCIWEQEIYNQFNYKMPLPHFHTFDTDDAPAGLNFSNDEEARFFAEVVQSKLQQRYQRKMDRKKVAARPNASKDQNAGNRPPKAAAPGITSPALPVTAVKSGKDTLKSKDKKKGKKKFCKEDIGTPTDFRHVGHVGWNPEKGL
ncbi:hypothetical protein CAPTEDRAFT_117654, partial [Capitella teleta]